MEWIGRHYLAWLRWIWHQPLQVDVWTAAVISENIVDPHSYHTNSITRHEAARSCSHLSIAFSQKTYGRIQHLSNRKDFDRCLRNPTTCDAHSDVSPNAACR